MSAWIAKPIIATVWSKVNVSFPLDHLGFSFDQILKFNGYELDKCYNRGMEITGTHSKGCDNLQVEIKLDVNCEIPKVVIYTREITNEITELANRLSSPTTRIITGVRDEKIYLLKPEEIYRFYSENQKIYADGEKGTFLIKHRLYELEEMLENSSFIRVSNSAIVNFDRISNLDMSLSGTMSLKFKNGANEFVSRRFVGKIKKYLGL
jgi:DNA-binding LytR/AlgR family response regulator